MRQRAKAKLLGLLVAALICFGAAVPATAQPPQQVPGVSPPQPWTITPSLIVAERFDDNIFLTVNNHTSDFITEITPGIALQYLSQRFSLYASYFVVGQYYAKTTDLNNFGDNQQAVGSLSYQATPDLALSVAGYYTKSSTTVSPLTRPTVPEAVVVIPTTQSTRTQTQEYSLTASAAYRFDPRTTGTASYSFAATETLTTPWTYLNSGALSVSYDLTSVDSISVRGIASFSTVSDGSSPDEQSYALTLGWRRQWTPNLTTDVAAGPLATDDGSKVDWGGTVTASVAYQVTRELTANLAYFYGTGLIVGDVGLQQTSTLTGSLAYQVLPQLLFLVTGGWTKSFPLGGSFNDGTDWVYASATAKYEITRWLSAFLTYQYTVSEPTTGGSIADNQVVIGLSFSYPVPLPF